MRYKNSKLKIISNDSETYISSGEYTFYVRRNAQGDITALTDTTSGHQDGTVYYTYSAYGKGSVQGISGDSTDAISKLNSMLFKGYMYDSDFKMYYLGSRWYDPEIGRFINGDSYISTDQGIIGYNMFAYCGNNPVNMSDSSGDVPDDILLKNAEIYAAGGNVAMCGRKNNGAKSAGKSDLNVTTSTIKSLPKSGEPNSNKTLLNSDSMPKRKRWCGPDSNAVRDRDYNHFGDMTFPHDHEWKDGVRQPDHLSPDPSYKFS